MNLQWQQQLLALKATISADQRVNFSDVESQNSGHAIYPLSHLSVLKVGGKDAVHFLQGQCTCNINELTLEKAGFGAFCNPKGRVISTFIMLPHQEEWLIIVPNVLLTKLQKQLQKYILRADVTLTDCRDEYCLTGFELNTLANVSIAIPDKHLHVIQDPILTFRLGENNARCIMLTQNHATIQLWSEFTSSGFIPHSTQHWELLDIYAGIPWLTEHTSEAFIPQMLNLEQLEAISFNKGCYTGQEIVARTHYLGNIKRAMYAAQAKLSEAPQEHTPIIDAENQQVVGSVLSAHCFENTVTALIILSNNTVTAKPLCLQNSVNTAITLL